MFITSFTYVLTYTTTAKSCQAKYMHEREREREREREFLTYHTQKCPCFIIGFLLVFAFKGVGGVAAEGPGFAIIYNNSNIRNSK